MKKHLIAAAVAAAVAAPAMAQTSVSLYGRLDVGYTNNVSDTGAAGGKTTNSGFNSGSFTTSRFGFSVSEDLGGGLKAIGTVETELNPTATNFSTLANRQMFVGLQGNFGTARLGRQYTPAHLIHTGFEPLGGANIAGNTNPRVGQTQSGDNEPGTFAAHTGAYHISRASNMLTYVSPTMNGFTLSAGLIKGTQKTDAANTEAGQKGQGLMLNYAAGPLKAAISTQTIKTLTAAVAATNSFCRVAADNITIQAAGGACTAGTTIVTGTTAAGANESKNRANAAGISYDFGFLTAYLTYADDKTENTAAVAAANERSNLQASIAVPMGALRLVGSISNGEYRTTANALTAAGVDRDIDGYYVGALYSMSKRTTLYALVGQNKMETANGVDAKDKTTAVGIRHDF